MEKKADKIIEKYCQAVGGLDKLREVEIKYTKGRYEEGDFSLESEFYWKRPNIRRMNWKSGEIIGGEGFDGETSWEINFDTGKAEKLAGAKADAARRGAIFEKQFIDYRKKGNVIIDVREDELLNEKVNIIELQIFQDWIKTYYFLKNGLLRAYSREMSLHGEGEDINLLSVFDTYKKIQGIKVYTEFREINKATGEVIANGKFDKIKFNEKVKAKNEDFIAPNPL